MAVLITGATGFLGSNLATALHETGQQVIGLGRRPNHMATLEEKGLTTVTCDLSDAPSQMIADRLSDADTVVHCAGLSSPWGAEKAFERANVTATRNLVQLAKDVGVRRFVFISTGSVYFRFADQINLTEEKLPDRFVNAYAKTKRQAEQIVLDTPEIGPVVLRPRGIYGAGDTALLPRLMRVAQKRPIPIFDPAGATDITHVDDVVSAIQRSLDVRPAIDGKVFNISGGVGIPLPKIIAAACEHVGITPRWRRVPFGFAHAFAKGLEAVAGVLPGRPEPPVTAYALGLMRYWQTMDLGAAKMHLGWQPAVSFEDGLSRTFHNGSIRRGVL